MKLTLNYWNPKNETVVTETGFRYLDTTSVITETKEINGNNDVEIFEQFYKMNNRLKYCNGSYFEFQDIMWDKKYDEWLKSDDFKKKSFDLYYGNGVVD